MFAVILTKLWTLLMIFSESIVLDGYFIHDLNQANWNLENLLLNISLDTKIPGSVHTTLLDHNFIKNPYAGYHDIEYAWIADQDWKFETTFKITDQLFDHPFVRLNFFGLDTIAYIYFNDELVGKSRNMFSKVTLPIHAINEINTLKVLFKSPTKFAKQQYNQYKQKYGYEVPPIVSPPVQHGRDNPNFIRKSQCSFSWDWGPSFPAVGIWKAVNLEFSNTIFFDEIKVTPIYQSGKWFVSFEVLVESYVKQDVEFHYGLNVFPQYEGKEKHLINVGLQNISLQQIVLEEHTIKRWWPVGYGEQYLYTGYVQVSDKDEGILKKETKFGFRTIELVEEAITDSPGNSFYFKINSQPIFLKGANWIPADSFQERVTEEVLTDLLSSVRDANMNALRIWGGGIYEQDRFYQLADELGILIWHDLMFAVALYPVNKEFLENVAQEVRYQIRRLHNHPSIIGWTGNNENEAAIAQTWWDEVKENKKQLISDYGKLYAETIKPIVESEDITRPFHLSSPSNGKENISEHYIAKNPQDSRFGDVHFYDYVKDCWNPETFPNPRFASEYGYQSYPSFEAISEVVTSDNQLLWNSSLLFHRQHHAKGNFEIEQFIQHHFELPHASNTTKEYLRQMIYLSQIVQALCIKYESEHYRRLQENLIDGEGHTMGALYWQLNDIWQAPSWSSIEYGGRWKILHYYVSKFFAPSIVSAYISGDFLRVNLIQDHLNLERIEDEKFLVNVTLQSWKKFGVQWNESVIIDRSSISKHSVEIYRKKLSELNIKDSSFIKIQLIRADFGDVISESEVFTSNFSSKNIVDPKLKITPLNWITDASNAIEIRCDSPAAFVLLESPLIKRFSDNGFVMDTPRKIVTFDSDSVSRQDIIIDSIKILSLYDVYKK